MGPLDDNDPQGVNASAQPAAGAGAAAAAVPSNALMVGLNAADNSEHAAEECASRARQIRIASLDPDVKSEALAEEIRATNLAGDCAQIEIDMKAARIKVTGLADDRVLELARLGDQLDRQIVVGQLLNAGLATVTSVLETAVKVRDILSDPSLSA